MKKYPFIKYEPLRYSTEESMVRSEAYYHLLDQRRSVRHFSDKAIPREIIDNLIMTGATAPSGAHKQPWTFCVVSDPVIKKEIRIAAEKEEFDSYNGRMSKEWLEDLAPLGTDWRKPFLEIAPYLIIIFKKAYDLDSEGNKRKNYYVNESVGIAAGFLISAIHNAGLVTLTHTPSPMDFLQKILDRPKNERPFLLLPVGYPADDIEVPDLKRKDKNEVTVYY